jgi:probable phosphoglycerate mutase
VAEIVLVRHGETEWSENGRHTSDTDLPLLEVGRERAARLKPALGSYSFGLVLCSPLRRARETCDLAGLGDAAELTDDLWEWRYGEYEGLTTPEIRAERPDWNLWRDGCPGGESPAEISARADRVIDRMRTAYDAGDNVAAFAHGHILRVVAARWITLGVEGGARLRLSPGTVSVLGNERENAVISRWNMEPAAPES